MSNNQVVIDTLNQKLEQLKSERDLMLLQYEAKINEVADAIMELSGQRYPFPGMLQFMTMKVPITFAEQKTAFNH